MLEDLSAGQWDDWSRFAAQRGLGVARNDPFWATFLAMYKNAHLPEGELPVEAADMLFYHSEEETEPDPAVFTAKLTGVLQAAGVKTTVSQTGAAPSA